MTQITVEIDDNEVKSVVKNSILAVEKLPKKVFRAEIETAKAEAAKYPPETPKQVYVRTGTYGRSFKIEPVGSGYRLISDARQKGRRYTKYVGGLADGSGQAKVHAGRWVLIADAMRRAVERIVAKGDEYFRAVMERNGAP